jgi:prophage antirepressor-like protein
VLLASLLFLSGVAESRVVSPRAVILRAMAARKTSPEVTERLVVAEVERLLRSQSSAMER